MEPIFAIGEKVRVTEREFGSYAYKYEYTDEMCDMFEGKIVTICQVNPNYSHEECEVEDDGASYYIKEDNRNFTWSSGMFDKISPPYFYEENKTNKNKEKARKALYASLEEQGIDVH